MICAAVFNKLFALPSSLMMQQVKDPVLSLQWLWSQLCPENFHIRCRLGQKEKKNKTKKTCFFLANLSFIMRALTKNSEGRKKIIFPSLQPQGWALGKLGTGGWEAYPGRCNQ